MSMGKMRKIWQEQWRHPRGGDLENNSEIGAEDSSGR